MSVGEVLGLCLVMLVLACVAEIAGRKKREAVSGQVPGAGESSEEAAARRLRLAMRQKRDMARRVALGMGRSRI